MQHFLSRVLYDTDLVFAARRPSWIVGVLPFSRGYESHHAGDGRSMMGSEVLLVSNTP
jgi:hypothetical protein